MHTFNLSGSHKLTYKVDSESHWASGELECSIHNYNITAILMDLILMEPGKTCYIWDNADLIHIDP